MQMLTKLGGYPTLLQRCLRLDQDFRRQLQEEIRQGSIHPSGASMAEVSFLDALRLMNCLTGTGTNHVVREMVANMTAEERDEGWERIYTYRRWLLSEIFSDGTVIVLPVGDARPSYREDPSP